MFFLALGLSLLSLAGAFDDFEEVCDPGYKVSEIKRSGSSGDKLGSLDVVCEAVDGAEAAGVTCEAEVKPFVCRGSKEFCPRNSWIGGIKGVELDQATGALLLGPVCCSAPGVKTRSCRMRKKLNTQGSAFEAVLKSSEVLAGFKCWRLYKQGDLIQDFIYKPQVCRIGGGGGGGGRSSTGSRRRTPAPKRSKDRTRAPRTRRPKAKSRPRKPKAKSRSKKKPKSRRGGRDPSVCKVCSCRCGPFTCPSGKRRLTLVHKRRKRATCQCVCDCRHRCVD